MGLEILCESETDVRLVELIPPLEVELILREDCHAFLESKLRDASFYAHISVSKAGQYEGQIMVLGLSTQKDNLPEGFQAGQISEGSAAFLQERYAAIRELLNIDTRFYTLLPNHTRDELVRVDEGETFGH